MPIFTSRANNTLGNKCLDWPLFQAQKLIWLDQKRHAWSNWHRFISLPPESTPPNSLQYTTVINFPGTMQLWCIYSTSVQVAHMCTVFLSCLITMDLLWSHDVSVKTTVPPLSTSAWAEFCTWKKKSSWLQRTVYLPQQHARDLHKLREKESGDFS